MSVGIIGAICVTLLGTTLGQEIITSPPATNWGVWGPLESCPEGTLAQGFQLLTERYQGPLIDDTTSNGLRLFCGDPLDPDTPAVTSTTGSWGKWGDVFSCGEGGYIYGFQLRVESNGIDDETATNNVRMFCTNQEPEDFMEGDGDAFGRWTEERKCARTEALCALQTQVQRDQGILLDDTALNNVAAMCCDIPKPTSPTTTATTTTPTTTTPTTTPTTTTPTTTPTTTTPTTTPTTTTPTTTPTTTTPTTTPTTTTPTTTPTTTTPTTTPTTTTPTTTPTTTTTPPPPTTPAGPSTIPTMIPSTMSPYLTLRSQRH